MLALPAVFVLALPVLAFPEAVLPTATAAPPAAAAGSYPGVVIGDAVNVRAGPGSAYDVVLQLQGGSAVTVHGETFGWLLVRPACELKVYVARDLVEPKGDGIALVARDRVNLRSKPAGDATVVGQANRGDLVRLLDTSGEFATLAAPPDVCFYVHRDLVRKVEVPSGAALERKGAPPAVVPAPTIGAGDKAIRARDLYLAELNKADVSAMDFAPAQKLFEEALREAKEDDVRAIAHAGLRRIRVAKQLQEDYRRRVGPIERMVSGDREPCGK